MSEFLYIMFSFLPFMVCLVWLAMYAVELRAVSLPKKLMTIFALACTTLYFCHSWFFMAEDWEYGIVDAIYLFCNLSVYPLFYCYLSVLTRDESFRGWIFLLLLPALAFSVLAYLTGGSVKVLDVAKVVFALEVVLVAVFGFMHLSTFDKEVRNYYSNTEGKTLRSTSVLLACFIVISLVSTVANLIGRDAFLHSPLLGIPSVLFSVMLFSIFHVSYKIDFWARDFKEEVMEDDTRAGEAGPEQENALLEERIAAAMEEQKLYLRPGLKISDVAAAVGSNRTYVSNAINSAGGMSFADYVNTRRVEYAKKRMKKLAAQGEFSISDVATEAGFASFPSFYRAFTKYERTSPSSWLKDLKG